MVVLGLTVATVGLGPTSAYAQAVRDLTRVSGQSPFATCTADDPARQIGTLYPDSEIEPWIDANPRDPANLIVVWQQDRWSNAAARGLAAGWTADGGRTWTTVVPPGVSKCAGGVYDRASDPWVSFGPDGIAYFMALVTNQDLPSGTFGANGMTVNRSTDGGRTWEPAITLFTDPVGQTLNDKNSITADPLVPGFAYAVWDRLTDFTLPPVAKGGGPEGARARSVWLRGLARSGREAATPVFRGPTWLSRTTDGGRTWQPARQIYDPGLNNQTIANQIVVTPRGTLVNVFTEILPNGAQRVAVIRSFNRGTSWSRPIYVANINFSSTGTLTPDDQQPVRDAGPIPDIAVNPRSGALYVVWQDTRFRAVDQVAFAQSMDDGVTWSASIRVDATPWNANILRQQAFVPSVEVGPAGEVIVTYYDFRRDTAAAGESTDFWARICRAGCARPTGWQKEIRLTTTSFNMLEAPVARGHFLGDYMGLVTAGRTVYPVFGVTVGTNLTDIVTRPLAFVNATATAAAAP
jgi:hypothetical protein